MKAGKRIVCINSVLVCPERKTVQNKNVNLVVHAGSTGLCGGCRKEGGRTYISIEEKGTTDMIVELITDKKGYGTGFEIAASGDAELISLSNAFAAVSDLLLESITRGMNDEA